LSIFWNIEKEAAAIELWKFVNSKIGYFIHIIVILFNLFLFFFFWEKKKKKKKTYIYYMYCINFYNLYNLYIFIIYSKSDSNNKPYLNILANIITAFYKSKNISPERDDIIRSFFYDYVNNNVI